MNKYQKCYILTCYIRRICFMGFFCFTYLLNVKCYNFMVLLYNFYHFWLGKKWCEEQVQPITDVKPCKIKVDASKWTSPYHTESLNLISTIDRLTQRLTIHKSKMTLWHSIRLSLYHSEMRDLRSNWHQVHETARLQRIILQFRRWLYSYEH